MQHRGHVSHVLSKRMSTAAMGWSRKGADRMARLRAYVGNKNGRIRAKIIESYSVMHYRRKLTVN